MIPIPTAAARAPAREEKGPGGKKPQFAFPGAAAEKAPAPPTASMAEIAYMSGQAYIATYGGHPPDSRCAPLPPGKKRVQGKETAGCVPLGAAGPKRKASTSSKC